MSFAIVTDSSCNLPNKMLEENNIEVISLKYFNGEEEHEGYQKGVEPDFKAFYALCRTKAKLTTTLASFERCLKVFEKVLSKGKDLLYIGFSSALSGTFQTARNVLSDLKEKYSERKIFSVDTLAASIGEGMLVLAAAEKRDSGCSIEETHTWLEENKLKQCHWFTVDDLFYLKRGGRVSGATALIGTALSIKPVMHVDNNGKLIAVSKAIGRKRSMDELVSRMAATIVEPEKQVVFVGHGDSVEDAEYCAAKIKEKMNVKDVIIHYIEPVIGCHSGPGTLALFFMGTER